MSIHLYDTYARASDWDFPHFNVLLLRNETNKASAESQIESVT